MRRIWLFAAATLVCAAVHAQPPQHAGDTAGALQSSLMTGTKASLFQPIPM